MKYAAELFGTFVLVMGGVGAAVLGGSQIGNLGVALAFGLSLLAMVYTIGPISGCYVNPAVTFGALLSGRIRFTQAVGYMLAQIMGAAVAAAIVLFIASGGPNGYKHVSESSPQHRASPLGRGMGFASDMVIYCHSIDWRCYCRCYLQRS
jgi:aquaporin Z